MGLHLFIGYNEDQIIKTDILYWDPPFIFETLEEEGIRMATIEEIAAMKLDVISRGGRKKDFWDLVELLHSVSLPDMLEIYNEKYPYHDITTVKAGLTNFSVADEMPDPICLRNLNWEMVKEKIIAEAGIVNT